MLSIGLSSIEGNIGFYIVMCRFIDLPIYTSTTRPTTTTAAAAVAAAIILRY